MSVECHEALGNARLLGDEAEREPPAPDQRVAAERDEDGAELRQRAELDDDPEENDERRRQLARRRPRQFGAARLDRLVVAGLQVAGRVRIHSFTVPGCAAHGLARTGEPARRQNPRAPSFSLSTTRTVSSGRHLPLVETGRPHRHRGRRRRRRAPRRAGPARRRRSPTARSSRCIRQASTCHWPRRTARTTAPIPARWRSSIPGRVSTWSAPGVREGMTPSLRPRPGGSPRMCHDPQVRPGSPRQHTTAPTDPAHLRLDACRSDLPSSTTTRSSYAAWRTCSPTTTGSSRSSS